MRENVLCHFVAVKLVRFDANYESLSRTIDPVIYGMSQSFYAVEDMVAFKLAW